MGFHWAFGTTVRSPWATSLPIVPGSSAIARSQLGAPDAITVAMQRGHITVVGADDSMVTYALSRHFGRVDSTADGGFVASGVVFFGFLDRSDTSASTERTAQNVSARPIPVPFTGPYTAALGPNGLALNIPATNERDGGLRVTLYVPKKLELLRLAIQTNGVITVTRFDGELSIQSESGPVLLNGIGGPALVEARNGRIRATVAHLPSPGTAGLDFLAERRHHRHAAREREVQLRPRRARHRPSLFRLPA